MKPKRFTFWVAGVIVALASNPAIANDVNYGGVTIPSQQTLSPATAKNIAFRPACTQLVPIEQGNRIFWTVTMADNKRIELAAYTPMSVQEAHFWLDAEGICKIGGVEVPLVYVDQVPQRQVAQVTTTPELPDGDTTSQGGQDIQSVTPQAPSAGPNWLPIAIGAPILLVIGWLFIKAVRGGDRRQGQPPKAAPKTRTGNDHASALNDIFGGGQ
ncbi:MAG: hypothetical protein AAF329_08770 [Cyanobacteria bacterium P01_A01_bin.17]